MKAKFTSWIEGLKQAKEKNLILSFALIFLAVFSVNAQQTISGSVSSKEGPIPGASIAIKGTSKGVAADSKGQFSISNVTSNNVLVISSIGYASKEITVGNQTVFNITLDTDAQSLNEVVVIGYGSQKKKDLTGAVVSISSVDFQKGNIVTPDQLVAGKVAGVQITSNGGAPGAGSTIRIRSGSSLNANNDPLIVIDGVPLDNNGITGAANALSFINPNDIESFNVLKDASATAIYGSRASNGVILITTKKGKKGDDIKVSVSSVASSAQARAYVDVLSAADFTSIINSKGTAAQKALLGKSSTDWQREIYRNAISIDNNVSITGSIKNMPVRASVGYLNQNGILKTSNMDRISTSIGVSPSFLNNSLKVDLNLKSSIINNHFANQGAIGTAVGFDPTQAVTGSEFGGYFEWLDPATKKPNSLGPKNPVALLNLQNDHSTVKRTIANAVFDYKMPFLPELRANANIAIDKSSSEGSIYIPAGIANSYDRGGKDGSYSQSKDNKTFEFYLNYVKNIGMHKVDIMGGYSYQDFLRENTDLDKNVAGTVFNNTFYKTQNTLVSFYGRANYTLNDKYLLTFTLRNDGSSRFSPENRWGVFPSAAAAWKISEEFKNSEVISDLKLRLGWGVTGQQDVFSDYPYLARYTTSEPNAQYQLGSTFSNTLRPEGYDANIKWEQTTTKNIGLDFGFKKIGITGSIDVYQKETKDLLSVIPVPAGSNLTNQILTNVGNLENKGVEISLNFNPIHTARVNWDFGVNATYNESNITNLTKVKDPTYQGILVGGISGGVGNTIQIHSLGYAPYTFFVYQQVYDKSGKPIEGLYVDRNGDGKISSDDRYRYQSPNSKYFLGASSNLSIDDFSFGFVLRANLGNYMYNNINSNNGVYRAATNGNNFLSNLVPNVYDSGFNNTQYFSDYYIQNASFLRVDNINFGYNLNRLLKAKKYNAQLSLNVQNAFILTKYQGLDPEVGGGIDNNMYPRPRTISLGLQVNF
ncbi:SusC/RagA family TonB-linked outer membrane protein [Aquirufa rosea]|nr:SusC/RagA family TonB-linked outer membrane protein [Aquirufa rosea]